ncbi:glutamate ABC transporter substrate-binding protein [Nakamurella lactea]|uniref:glutamate ABC transporter substrate-binding protein n=1 Tax=Nakamurella lactea TaxID=459515 RepID=UPI0004071F84|nr:glutamate ABC transporter substrate-binding protein [Nakamurella lactea]
MRRIVPGRRGRPIGAAPVVVAFAVGLTVLAGCSSGSAGPAEATDNGATGNAKLTIGIADDEPGVSIKTDNGYAGFDIDTANYVAGKLGVPTANITWKPVDPGERISALEKGEVDLVVATFSITPEREQQVSFAGPYFIAHQDLLIRRNDTSITSPETLNGKILCEASGTTSADYVTQHYAGKITVREVPTFSECVRNLANGDVDAVSTDDLILAGFAAEPQYKGILKVVGKGFTDERYGIGVKKGDTELVAKVNAALRSYIDDGSWKRSLDRNIRPSGYGIPDPPAIGG